MVREVMTSSEMAEDQAPSDPMTAPGYGQYEQPINPLWVDRSRDDRHRNRPTSLDENISRPSRRNSQAGGATTSEEV